MTGIYSRLLIAVALILAGCIGPIGDAPTASPDEIQADDFRGDTVRFRGEMGDNRTHFVMRGQLLGCWTYNRGPANCSDVTIELYAKNGTHLRTFQVGYLNGSKNISFVAPVVPYYVLIRSPDFWGYSFNEIDYYERGSDGRYWVRVVIERDEFPDAINVTNAD